MTAPSADPTRTSALAGWLLQALTEELAASPGGRVGVTLIAPGGRPPPADWCCTGEDGGGPTEGMAWARINRRYPSSSFPSPDTLSRRCGAGAWAAEIELGVYRCAHVLGEDGTPPAPELVTADALMCDADAAAMQAAICRLRWPYAFGGWSTLGPSGGIVGGAQLVTVALTTGPIGRN